MTKQTHTWKTLSDAEVTATCELILTETQFADGYNRLPYSFSYCFIVGLVSITISPSRDSCLQTTV